MRVIVEHLGGTQFTIRARQHTVVCDQPIENAGFDEGMTPPELFLASLGACAGFYAAQYFRKYDLVPEGVLIHVSAEKEKNPARLDDFKVEVEVPSDLSETHRQGVEQAVSRCLIHNTLLHPPRISLKVVSGILTEA